MPGSGESLKYIHRFLGGVDSSHATGMGILGSEYQSAHVEWCQPRISWSQLKRKGGGGESGVVGRPLPTKRGNPSGMRYTKAATRFQVIDNPCSYQGHRRLLAIPGHQRLPAVKCSSTFLCLYQVMGDSFVYTRRSELFTPVPAVWRELLGPKYSRGAIPGPFECVAPGRARSTPVGRFWAASFLQLSRLRNVHNGRRPFSTM